MIRSQAAKPGSGSRFRGSFGRQKPSFLENFRTTLSGPQHLPIAKNEEAKRHDRGTLSQNEGLRRLPGFTSQQCLYPVEIREIGKELQLAGLELCRETFHEETPGMTSKSWPIARTLRSAVAAAINEAIGGTNADPVSQSPARPESATNLQDQETR